MKPELEGSIVPNGKKYYLEYSSFNISEDGSKKSVGKVAVLAFFRQIITRILNVLVAMALVGLLWPFIQRYFSSIINKRGLIWKNY